MSEVTLVGSRVLRDTGIVGRGWVRIRDDRIVALGEGDPLTRDATIDLTGHAIAPGLVDLHVHGGLGHDFLSADEDAIDELSMYFARHGVTGFLATTHTAPIDRIHAGLDRLAVSASRSLPGARMLGINLEGPYISERRRGAHPSAHLRRPDLSELVDLLDRSPIRVVTIAPELPGARELIKEVARRGLVPSIGHSDASAQETYAAVDEGASLVTHVFNGMSGIHHRQMGVAGAALLDDRLVCEVIADGVHLDVEALRLAWETAGPERIALVTDAGPAMGAPDGIVLGSGAGRMRVAGGVTVLADGTISSSTRSLDHGVRTMASAVGVDVLEAWPSASTVPAAVLEEPETGLLCAGARADLVAVDAEGEVRVTMVGGRIVWDGR